MRRAKLKILYNGRDISADITGRLISFSYNDNRPGEADDLEITVHNRDGLWTAGWYPDKGAVLKAGLILEGREASEGLGGLVSARERLSVDFGTFTIDGFSAASSGIFTIGAIASVCEGAFKNEKRSRTWQNATLREIVSGIASENGLALLWKSAGAAPVYERVYQIDQTDASFIYGRAAAEGLNIKVSESKISVYGSSLGSGGTVLSPEDLSSYSFRSRTFGVYGSCRVDYLNPDTNETVSFEYKDPKIKSGKTLVINTQADTRQIAETIAKAELKSRNARETSASVELMGNPGIWSGQDAELKGFGVFSGTYTIGSVSHVIDRNGYRTKAAMNIKN